MQLCTMYGWFTPFYLYLPKQNQLCLHVEVSDELPADAVARERASFVSRCTDRLARAADTLRAGGGNGGIASSSDGGAGVGENAGNAEQVRIVWFLLLQQMSSMLAV